MDELNCPKTPIRLHQICIGGENVGKISREKLWFYKKKKCCKLLSYSTLLSLSQCVFLASHVVLSYPEPGSNRHGLPHWCLRPARLPIPPSGLESVGKAAIKREPTYLYDWPSVSSFANCQLPIAAAKLRHFFEIAKISDKKLKNLCIYQRYCVI